MSGKCSTSSSISSGSMELEEIPMGFKFLPTHEELMQYLVLKVTGKTLPCDYAVTERDLYNAEEVQGIFEGAKSKHKVYYFFTKLKKKSKRGSNIDRTVGRGTWKGQQKKHKDGSGVMQRSFCYENKESKEHHKKWTMIEYYLPPLLCKTDYVLCRVTNKKEKKDDDPDDDDGVLARAEVEQNHHLEGNIVQLAPSPHPLQQLEPAPTLVDNPENEIEMQWYMKNIDFGDEIFDGNNYHLENQNESSMALDTDLLINDECFNNQNTQMMQMQQYDLQNVWMDDIWVASPSSAPVNVFEGDEWFQLNQLLAELFPGDPILNPQLL